MATQREIGGAVGGWRYWLLALLAVVGPGAAFAAAASGPMRVVVSIAPLKELAERLVPAGVVVEVLIPLGVSEHGFEIAPRALMGLGEADVVVFVGLGLEPQVEKFLRERPRAGRREVSFAAAVGQDAEQADGDHEGHDHAHGEACEHGHGTDPHLWLDPRLVAEKLVPALSEAVADALRLRGVAGAVELARLGERTASLRADLLALDGAFAARLERAESRTIVVGHDAFGWLAKRYGLTTVAIHGLAAQEPKPSAIAAAAAAVREHGLKVVFSEPQLSAKASKRVAQATGARVLTLDPLGDGTYFAFMRRNLDALCEAIACGPVEKTRTKKGADEHEPAQR